MSEYNVIGSEADLAEMLRVFPGLVVADRWACYDWNVKVDVKEEDNFLEWCDEHAIKTKLV